MFRRVYPRTLRTTLFLLLSLALLPVLVVHTGLDLLRVQDRREIELQANLELARAVSRSFDVYTQNVLRQELMVGTAFVSVDPIAHQQGSALLLATVREIPSLDDMVWASPGGEILASTQPDAIGLKISDREYYKRIVAGEGWAVGSLFRSPVNQLSVFVIARGLRDAQGNLRGIVAGFVDPGRFGEVFQIARARRGVLTILDGDGRPVYRYPEVRWTHELREQGSMAWLTADIVAGTERTGTLSPGALGEESMFASVPIRSAGWLVVASRPESEVMGPVMRELWGDAAAVLLVGLGAFLVALMAGRLISRPIGDLDRWLAAIGRGQLDLAPAIGGPRELRRLGGAIAHMAGELRSRQLQNRQLLAEAGAARREAEAARQEVTQLLESITDGFFALDRKGEFTYLNREAERLLRGTRDHLEGRNFQEVFPTATSTRFHDEYRKVIKTNQPRVVLDFYPPYDAWFEAHIYPTEDGTAVFFQDVTSRVEAELEIRRARDVAEEANRAKGDFLANISHEIRTPMNAVLGLTQLVLQDDLSPEQHRQLSMVKSNAESLMGLINNVLDFSKIESGRIDLVEEPFSLRDTVEKAAHGLAVRAHEKGLELVCDVPTGADVPLSGDASRLRQVLVNLVGNAIKFTERGEVCVRATTSRVEGPDRVCRVVLEVRDTGIGIPADKMGLLFQKFSQVDSSVTREHGGTGLGLAISQQIAHAMGGEIRVESLPGRGSTFTFSAPFKVQPGVPGEQPPASGDLEGLRVLVAEDSDSHRTLLQRTLGELGAEVCAVADGVEALQVLRDAEANSTPFDVALLDVQMPGRNGHQVVQELRASGLAAPRLALMIASIHVREEMARCRRAGVDSCLVKPIRFDEIVAAVGGTPLGAGETEPMLTTETGGTQPRPVRHRIPGNILLAEDNPANRILVQSLLEKRGWRVVTVDNGSEALDALAEQDFDVVLMDAQMPLMDGYEATRLLRKREASGGAAGRHTPVICVTAHAMRGDRERCLAAGMDDYLPKPIDADALCAMVERHLVAGSAPPVEGAPPAELKKALKRIQGDWALLRTLVENYAGDYPVRLSLLREEVGKGDAEQTRRVAHALKGVFSMFEAKAAYELSIRIESLARDSQLQAISSLLPDLEAEAQRLAQYLEWATKG